MTAAAAAADGRDTIKTAAAGRVEKAARVAGAVNAKLIEYYVLLLLLP